MKIIIVEQVCQLISWKCQVIRSVMIIIEDFVDRS